ANRKK
ncbi:ABC transporter family protein, partial [Vibrio parahaemolyticus V-223/04]